MLQSASPFLSDMAAGAPPVDAALLDWYDRHHRELPWRVSPAQAKAGRRADPYHVWLSEIMLQQTTVKAVHGYFLTFMERWPSIADLAAAPETDILKAWAGLGYYSRARNLKKCADLVVAEHGGRFPDTVAGLKALPGIGDYTAAAIAAIAFGRQVAVVDGNVERVISRLAAIASPLPKAKAEIHNEMARLTPAGRPGDFAQAMMDLGATICTPRKSSCILCPIKAHCAGLAAGDPERFPVKAPKKEKPVRLGAAFIASAPDGAIFLRRRKETGLLAGMSEVPTTGFTARADGATDADAAPFPADWKPAGAIAHIFTHFELRLTVHHTTLETRCELPGGWWSAPEELAGEALPTVMKKAIQAAIPDAFRATRLRKREKP